jgi:hypothetical protein
MQGFDRFCMDATADLKVILFTSVLTGYCGVDSCAEGGMQIAKCRLGLRELGFSTVFAGSPVLL